MNCIVLTIFLSPIKKTFLTNPWDHRLNMEPENEMKTFRFILVLENRDSYSMFFRIPLDQSLVSGLLR